MIGLSHRYFIKCIIHSLNMIVSILLHKDIGLRESVPKGAAAEFKRELGKQLKGWCFTPWTYPNSERIRSFSLSLSNYRKGVKVVEVGSIRYIMLGAETTDIYG